MKATITLATLTLAVLTPTVGASEALPIEHFVRHGDYLDVTISPDGEHLAARVRNDGLVGLLFIRRSDGEVVGGVRGGKEDVVHTVTWVNDKRVVYELAENFPFSDTPISTGEAFAVNVDGRGRRHLYGFRATDARTGSRLSLRENTFAHQRVLSTLEHDDSHILIIEYPWQRPGTTHVENGAFAPTVSRLTCTQARRKRSK